MGEKIKVGQLSKLIVLNLRIPCSSCCIRYSTKNFTPSHCLHQKSFHRFVLDKHAIPMKFCVSDVGYHYLKGNMSLLQDPPVEF